MIVRFRPSALREHRAQRDYYERNRPNLGQRYQEALERLLAMLCESPRAGRVLGGKIRAIPLHGFSLRVIYAVVDDYILVVAIAHDRRRPGYWAIGV